MNTFRLLFCFILFLSTYLQANSIIEPNEVRLVTSNVYINASGNVGLMTTSLNLVEYADQSSRLDYGYRSYPKTRFGSNVHLEKSIAGYILNTQYNCTSNNSHTLDLRHFRYFYVPLSNSNCVFTIHGDFLPPSATIMTFIFENTDSDSHYLTFQVDTDDPFRRVTFLRKIDNPTPHKIDSVLTKELAISVDSNLDVAQFTVVSIFYFHYKQPATLTSAFWQAGNDHSSHNFLFNTRTLEQRQGLVGN